MTAINEYRALCAAEPSIPVFSQDWWLDAAAGEGNWDVVLEKKDDHILGSLPFVVKRRYGFTLLTQPPLTQHIGPWLRPDHGKVSQRLAREKDVLSSLYSQLPKFDYYQHNWHYSRTNWLPLYWMNFKQTTRYTYVINGISDISQVVANFEHSKRKDIRKSEGVVEVVFDIPARDFYENHKMTLSKQGQRISYSFDLFERLYRHGYERNQAKTIAAFDQSGNLHAALFVVWDKVSAYDLISTIDPAFRTYGAASLLVREIIKYVSQYVNTFDFEGSMIEGVERSFRRFGAVQVPYFSISKARSRTLKTVLFLRSMKEGR